MQQSAGITILMYPHVKTVHLCICGYPFTHTVVSFSVFFAVIFLVQYTVWSPECGTEIIIDFFFCV